ncbi:hypothetical protein, partial [Nostoc sp.]
AKTLLKPRFQSLAGNDAHCGSAASLEAEPLICIPLHWCQLKPKSFLNLVSSKKLEMLFNCGSAASLEAEPLIGIPSLRLGTRQSLKAAYRLAFSLS